MIGRVLGWQVSTIGSLGGGGWMMVGWLGGQTPDYGAVLVYGGLGYSREWGVSGMIRWLWWAIECLVAPYPTQIHGVS